VRVGTLDEPTPDAVVPPAGEQALIDAEAAAGLLGVPPSWVLAQARAGRIPHVRLGRYVRFEPEQLEAWWQARRRGPSLGSRARSA